MTTLTSPERVQSDRAAEIFSQVEGEIRDFVRRDVAGSWRPTEEWTELTPGNVGWLLQRASGDAVQQIDASIEALRALCDKLQAQTTRVQRELAQYAGMNEAAQSSIRTISDSIAFWQQGGATRPARRAADCRARRRDGAQDRSTPRIAATSIDVGR